MRAWIVLLSILPALGCDRRKLDSIGEPGTPLVIQLSPAYSASGPDVEALRAFLARESGLAVDVKVATTPQTAVASTGGRDVDAWLLPLFDYLLATQLHSIEAELQVLRTGEDRTYGGVLLVRADSGATTLSDLQGKRIAFVHEHSTSGFVFPAALLKSQGVAVEPLFTGSHGAAIAAVREGRADAAATHAPTAADPSLRVLARTARIPNEPVAFRRGVPSAKREAIKRALTAFARTPDGQRVLGELGGITGFADVDDGAYRDVHETIRVAGKAAQDLVPGGWRVYNESRGSLSDYAP